MRITPEAIHDLTAEAVRLSAIVNLLRDPETRPALDPIKTDTDVRAALRGFARSWAQALENETNLNKE